MAQPNQATPTATSSAFAPNGTGTGVQLLKILESRQPLRGVTLFNADCAFDVATIATDPEAAANAAIALLYHVAAGEGFGTLRDVIAPKVTHRSKPPIASLDNQARLAATTLQHARVIAERLADCCSHRPPEEWIDAERGMHHWDACLTDYLSELGDVGAGIAGVISNDSKRRATQLQANDPQLRYEGHPPSPAAIWKQWSALSGTLCLWIEALAEALWFDKLKPEIERELRRRTLNHEALAMPIHVEIVKLHSRAGVHDAKSRQLKFDDGSSISFDSPFLDETTLAVVSRGVELLSKSVDAHRVLHWEVRTGYLRWLSGIEPAHVLDVERGYGELAELLGVHRDKRAPERLRAILMAQRMCSFPLPGPGNATGNLVILSEWKGSGRRPGRIRVELSSALMPTYVHELAGELKGRELAAKQKLVPLADLPPFIGRERDHGSQATLAMLATRELRYRAPEVYLEGGARISLERWAALAEEARIPRSQVNQQLRPILDRWTQDGDDGPKFLSRMGSDIYTLGDAHEAALRFIVDAGKREANGREGGKRSVLKRESKLKKKLPSKLK